MQTIKYYVGSQTNSLRKGDFHFGVGYNEYGPTSSSDHWSQIDPPTGTGITGGCVLYIDKASGGPSIYSFDNPDNMIGVINEIENLSLSNLTDTLSWIDIQNNYAIISSTFKDIPAIGNIKLVIDADQWSSLPISIPSSNAIIKDLSQTQGYITANNSDVLGYPNINHPWEFRFNGTDTYGQSSASSILDGSANFTIIIWVKITNNSALMYLLSLDNLSISIPDDLSKITVSGSTNNDSFNYDATYSFVSGNWYMITIIADQNLGTIKTWINNTQYGSATYSGNLFSNSKFYIGADINLLNPFRGSINSIYIWEGIAINTITVGEDVNGLTSFWLGTSTIFGY